MLGRSGVCIRRRREQGGMWRGGWTRVGHGGACSGAWQPCRQNVEHVASVGVGKVGAELGQIWTDLDHRSKTKFVHLGLLYISH